MATAKRIQRSEPGAAAVSEDTAVVETVEETVVDESVTAEVEEVETSDVSDETVVEEVVAEKPVTRVVKKVKREVTQSAVRELNIASDEISVMKFLIHSRVPRAQWNSCKAIAKTRNIVTATAAVWKELFNL